MARKILATFVLDEAKAGNLGPLVARIGAGTATQEERELAAALLEQLDGNRGKAALRQIEWALIAQRVEGLISEEGFSTEAAVALVAQERPTTRKGREVKRSRSDIFKVLRESKNRS
jgi:hypothetical protein